MASVAYGQYGWCGLRVIWGVLPEVKWYALAFFVDNIVFFGFSPTSETASKFQHWLNVIL